MRVLLRVDAGPHIGLGHLQRCLSLAAALRQAGAGAVFLTNPEPTAQERVRRFGFEGEGLRASVSWSAADLDETAGFAQRAGCQAVVVDSDYEGEGYLAGLRQRGLFVCAIEDMAPHAFPCQLVVNGDAHARELPYTSSSGDTVFIVGPECAFLREDLWDVPERATRPAVRNLLVMVGGYDAQRLMPDLLRTLGELPDELVITAVVGPFVVHQAEIADVAASFPRRIRLVSAPDSVRALMLEADLAVTAGGQTLYELARTGCPAVAFSIADNQDGQLAAFHRAGCLRSLGRVTGRADLCSGLRKAVTDLLQDAEARAAMSRAGQRMIDGQGALRVAQELLSRQARPIGSTTS